MKTRIITSLVIWAVLILALYLLKVIAGAIILVALSLVAQHELYLILERLGYKPWRRLGLALGGLTVLMPVFFHYGAVHCNGVEMLVLSVIVCGLASIFSGAEERDVKTMISTVFGILLVPFMLQFLIKVVDLAEPGDAQETQAILLAFWIIVTAKMTDVGGFIFGKAFGKNKLAPSVSPGKTWEGAVGGIITSVAVGTLILMLFRDHFPIGLAYWEAALIAVPVGAVAICSDLFESVFKRQAGVKDSGNSIPGLGGGFDVADSLIFSAPLAYLLLRLAI